MLESSKPSPLIVDLFPAHTLRAFLRDPQAKGDERWAQLPVCTVQTEMRERFRNLLKEGRWNVLAFPGSLQKRENGFADLRRGLPSRSIPLKGLESRRQIWALLCQLDGAQRRPAEAQQISVHRGFLVKRPVQSMEPGPYFFDGERLQAPNPFTMVTFWRRRGSPLVSPKVI